MNDTKEIPVSLQPIDVALAHIQDAWAQLDMILSALPVGDKRRASATASKLMLGHMWNRLVAAWAEVDDALKLRAAMLAHKSARTNFEPALRELYAAFELALGDADNAVIASRIGSVLNMLDPDQILEPRNDR